jgi:hypothetical protein
VSVRVLPGGEQLSIQASLFEERFEGEGLVRRSVSMKRRRLAVWYNPGARVVLGITLFDQRLVPASPHSTLPTADVVVAHVAVTAALLALGVFLVLRPYRRPWVRLRAPSR